MFQGEFRSGSESPEKPFQLFKIHYKKSGEILFYFEAGTGKPEYNSNAIYGRLAAGDSPGHLWYLPKDTTVDCSLDLTIDQNRLKVLRLKGSSFSNGAVPYGIYYRVKRSDPGSFIDRSSQQVYFDKTSPENYKE